MGLGGLDVFFSKYQKTNRDKMSQAVIHVERLDTVDSRQWIKPPQLTLSDEFSSEIFPNKTYLITV